MKWQSTHFVRDPSGMEVIHQARRASDSADIAKHGLTLIVKSPDNLPPLGSDGVACRLERRRSSGD
jgi:hypothetical protein